jgi:diguanylate cyclase (GGDEF)-like protein
METLSILCSTLRRESFYWRIGFWALVVAGSVHLLFVPLFWYLDLPVLVLVNVFSVLIYLFSILVLGLPSVLAKDDRIIGWLVYLELLGHGMIATYCLGAGSGFQYYIYILAVLPFFVASYSPVVKLLRLAVVVIVSLVINIYFKYPHPDVVLDQHLIETMGVLNLSVFLIAAGGISLVFTLSSNSYLEKLSQEAMVDQMTGLYNRRHMATVTQKHIEKHAAEGGCLSLLIVDIDNFKNINDSYGHVCGDSVVISTARVIHEAIRTHCIASRWGGDEFVVFFPDTTSEELDSVANRIMASVSGLRISCGASHVSVTITCGGATGCNGEDFRDLFARADRALYVGKENGRNRYVSARDDWP